MEKNTSQGKMEEEQFVDICAEKIDDKRIEEKERKRDKEKDRDRERRRSKHKESRKAERKEGREREEHPQRRAIGEEVQIDKKEEEFKGIDYEGQIMDHGHSVIITQTPLSCGEDNLIIKDEKSGKSIRSGVAYNRGTTVDSGSKGRSREERHGTAHTQHRGERDSKAGGEKLLDRSEKASHPESRKGGSENIRPASEERESWVDPYISPRLCRPKYSYRESIEKHDGAEKHHHHERKRYPSPESLTEPSYHTAQILLSSAEPKGNHAKHRGADKTPRSEARDSNRKRSESRQSPNVHLYMSELAPPSLETKMLTPNPHSESRAPGEHKRRSRRSAKEDSATGNSAHTVRPPEEETADGRDNDKVKVVSEAPGDRGAAEAVGNRGRSREDKGSIGHRGERDSKGGGEKVHDRWEISLSGDPPECRQGGPEKHKTTSEDRDISESSSINPSSRRPKYSYRASLEKGESRGELEKHAAPYCMPAEPNLRISQKMEYTVMSNILSPELRRKHLKHHKSSLPKDQQQVNGEAAAKELGGLQPDEVLQSMVPHHAAPSKTHPKPPPAAEQTPSGVGDVPLPPEQPARKARKNSTDNKGATTAASAASESRKGHDSGSAAASKSEGDASTAAGVKSPENWGKRVSPELQAEAKHGVGPPEAEKRENNQGTRSPNSRRPRYSYGTDIDMEDEGFYPLNKSISSYSQWPVDSVLRVTKSEYMVASSSSSPVSIRKLIKYTSCLADQPSTLSNFINKAKQLEIATSMQPTSAYGLPSKPFPLGSAGPAKGGPRGACNGVDMGCASLASKEESDPGVQGELCAPHPQDRRRRESQRGIHCRPFLHHLPDGDADRRREEASPADVKLGPAHSNTSLRHRATPSLGGTLTDGSMCLDVPRPIVSASRNNLIGISPYGNEIVSSKIWTKCGHFKQQQHQECPKRSLQTRKRYQEEVKAALMIQAAWKGYQTRAQIRKQAEAAVVIQAAYRGYQIRKFLTDGMGVNATDELNEAQDGHWQDSEYPEIFLEEISHSDYSDSEPDSGDDWLDSPVSVIVGSPGSCGPDNASREDPPPVEVYSPTPVLQYESVYQSQRCNWGEV